MNVLVLQDVLQRAVTDISQYILQLLRNVRRFRPDLSY